MVEIKYFVHGTTTDNLKKKATGWLHGKLSEKGISQANALAETIKNEYFDIVFCSDLNRAIESAKIDFQYHDVDIIQDSRIRECNYGDLDGKDSSLVVYSEHITKPFPNGESMKDVEKRIKSFLEFLQENYDGKKVGIVAHRAPQLAIEVLTLEKSWEEAISTDWRNTKDWKPGWNYVVDEKIKELF